MVEEKLEPEVKIILTHIAAGENFLLSGGAGSGKTFSLVQIIKKIIKDNPFAKVACMTYTNAAVKEIEERVDHDNLSVTTIHDFLWDNIKFFQKEIKKSLIHLINDESADITSQEAPIAETYFDNIEDGIQYKEFTRLKDGIISHDELLILGNYMYKTFPLLADILKDKFQFIFIDEYQDTNKLVVEIFLESLKHGNKNNIIGFFGDSMQSIYDDGIGDLEIYIDSDSIKEVAKKQNRRNPQLIIDLANRLRTDGIIQEPSVDLTAPNMLNGVIKTGSITFLHSAISDLNIIRKVEIFKDWDFKNSKATKELNLTHNLIAPKAGFLELMSIYDKDPIMALKSDIIKRIKDNNLTIDETQSFEQIVDAVPLQNRSRKLKKDIILEDPIQSALYNELKDLPFSVVRRMYLSKDALIDDKKQDEDDENKKGSKRDKLIKHLFKIQHIVHLYKEKRYNEFIRRTDIAINSIKSKVKLKEIISSIETMSESTIEEVIHFAHEKGICIKDDKLNDFITNNSYLYNRVKKIKFKEFQNLYLYLEGFTPFSTQHKIKGAEFDNVLVILDNGGWNSSYNFENLFLQAGSENVLKKTQKIFYVCCTRAKERLVVFYHNPPKTVITKAIEWFGAANVIEVNNI